MSVLDVVALATALRFKCSRCCGTWPLKTFRDKDRTHLRDLLEFGLIDANWCERFPPELAARLQILIDSPEG
jgi:hypothetical protein